MKQQRWEAVLDRPVCANEMRVLHALKTAGIDAPDLVNQRVPVKTELSPWRPDLAWFRNRTFAVIVEIDENAHRNRSSQAEYERAVQMRTAMQLPTVLIRFNPGSFHIRSVQQHVDERSRFDWLILRVRHWLGSSTMPQTVDGIYTEYLFYGDAGVDRLPLAASQLELTRQEVEQLLHNLSRRSADAHCSATQRLLRSTNDPPTPTVAKTDGPGDVIPRRRQRRHRVTVASPAVAASSASEYDRSSMRLSCDRLRRETQHNFF